MSGLFLALVVLCDLVLRVWCNVAADPYYDGPSFPPGGLQLPVLLYALWIAPVVVGVLACRATASRAVPA
ncbi:MULTISPECIES: hypothetical protein [unclassified Nocardioides]|uniref:hypothetical protein n=1 Tax=unclassified Nocardioides TaxID=2615069 RepID=UPI0007037100|nr:MULTISPECIES: hypothetical protein [unclassified Nocardioides]KRC55062.1 hypothetical protein ASE19_06420 [Nocardioides sp. Root79]KRC72058.1 hypothetical protein ASE20_05285 [Nocardioides sp. Root240]